MATTQSSPQNSVSTVHICLVSGQLIPNFLGVLAPDQNLAAIYLVVTDNPTVRSQAQWLGQVLRAWKHDLKIEYLNGAPSGRLSECREFAKALIARIRVQFPASRVVCNATGGTKPLSLGFLNAIDGEAGFTVIYCDTDTLNFDHWYPEDGGTDKMRRLLKAKWHLLLQGFGILA